MISSNRKVNRDSNSKMSSFREAGLGASLGVPQSALESVTSLDPKDYVYPNLDSDFMITCEGQLGNKGSKESMQVFSYETACSRERAQSAALLLGSGLGGGVYGRIIFTR